MNRKNLIAIIYSLVLSLCLISCAKQPEQKVEAQQNIDPEQNSKSNNKAVNKNATADKNSSQSGEPIIKPSDIIGELRKKKNANPTISPNELAVFGNELLKAKGYDFTFDWEPKGKKNEENLRKSSELNYENYLPFEYQFTKADGEMQKFELLNNGFNHPCYSPIDVPVTQINEQTMTVISEGKEIKLKKPKDFGTEEFVLVNNAKKPIRIWKTPIDATPVGISEDGKKVYFESWQFSQDQTQGYKESPIDLAVEISADGSLKFVALNEIKSGKGEVIDYDKKPSPFEISRKQLAKFLVDCLETEEFFNKALILSEKP